MKFHGGMENAIPRTSVPNYGDFRRWLSPGIRGPVEIMPISAIKIGPRLI